MTRTSIQEKSLSSTGEFVDITISLGQKKKLVEIRETGQSFFTVVLDSISKIGGLYTSLFGILAMIKHKLT